MKIKFLLAACIAIAIALSSCSDEGGVPDNQIPQASHSISFNISIPKGDPVTYAIHDAAEWGIKSLWLYEFDATGKLLSTPANIASSIQGTGPNYSYSKEIKVTDKGVRQFLFVSNEAVPSGFTVGNTIEELQTKLSSNTLASSSAELLNTISGAQAIPMTGRAIQGNNNNLISVTGNTSVSVSLSRIVARIDVQNNTPKLVIKDIKLMNTNTNSFLLPALDKNGMPNYNVPTSNKQVSNIGSFASLPTPFDNSTANAKLAKAFYLYEGVQASKDKAVSVQIKAELDGTTVLYSIPFWQNDKGITVKRNHIYYLVLGDGSDVNTGADVTFSIGDTPWNGVSMDQPFEIISAKYMAGIGTFSFEVINTSTGKKGDVLAIDKNEHTGIPFDFKTQFANHTEFNVSVVDSPAWITNAAFNGNRLTFDIQQNTTAKERKAIIEVSSGSDTATKYRFLVKQGA